MSDWADWLGPAAEQMSDEQRDRFAAEAAAATERIGDDPDLAHEREAAWSAIVQYLLGETTLDEAGAARRAARAAERETLLVSQAVARLAALDGVPEAEVARRAGLDRMQVRKLLGKR
jgi:hypothetical protein